MTDHLQGVTEALAAARTQASVLDAALRPALRALGAVAAAVLLVDELAGALRLAGQLDEPSELRTAWQDVRLDARVPAADVLRTCRPLYFEDAAALEAEYPGLEERGAILASAWLPMVQEHRPLGTLVLSFREPHTFTPEERAFLQTLAEQCAVALERAGSLRMLEQHVEDRSQKILEDARAQEAFVAFTEAVGSESDLPTLIRQSITVLQTRFPGASISYFEEEGELWKARVWSDDVRPELAASISAGLPIDTPMLTQLFQTRRPVFTDAWDARREAISLSEEYGAVATYPLIVNGELRSLLSVGLRTTRTWTEADQGMVRAVGRGLNLALERTQTARHLMIQNAELQARTHALEAFADLTRDLALSTDPLLLIRRAQEVMMSMLADGSVLYYEPQGGRWHSRVQHGSLHSPGLQAAVDAGLPYTETQNLLIPWTTGQPYFQDVYDHDTDALADVVGPHIAATATMRVCLGGKPIGVLAIVLFQQRTWSTVDRVLLETAVQSLELALDRAVQTRRLDEERAALEAFTRFTELVGSQTDVQVLVRQAISLLADACGVEVAYFERDGELFKASVWTSLTDLTLLGLLQRGFPLQNSGIAQVLQQNTAAFIDHWNDTGLLIAETGIYQAVAGYPYFVDGALRSVLLMGTRTSVTWDERSKGIFRAVGRSLDLALDRARQTLLLRQQRDALNARTQELAVANQELEAFSYSVSHDLRTPVRHMTGFLQLARSSLDGKLDDRSARYLNIVEQAGSQMNALIDALLDLSRAAQQPLKPSPVDLNEIMAQLQEALVPDLLSRNVRWEVGALPSVWGDRAALKLVLTQLTENALKFTRTRDPAHIRVWAEDQGDAWGVFVKDNGLGFDPRYQDRLFNLFQRLHTTQEVTGTGVGLASVRRLILKHGGQVFAEGQLDHGATFGFTLPKMPQG